ncbi:hypothetical protein F5883DRAFT_126203 [Diaporthe sp. PMI_573]|nr:hypothetical protein F5883DRAFT_126203 [Diaporthaceae sp. PMI_573]
MDIPVPVGIDFSSFESCEQASMVQRCLIIVLDRFNANNVGPKFQFVHDPFHSAFFVRFGGDYPRYANSFFPDSHPKDWYIDVFKAGLTLSAEQEQFLINTTRRRNIRAARSRALEQNLVKILTHEMLHVVGVRHCDAHLTEKAQPCVRFPPDLTDDENNEEHLMQRMIHWKDLSWIDWKSRTLEEIRQIYVEERKYIGPHKIRDVSWQAGAEERRRIAMSIARCCNPRPQDKQ